MFVLVVMGKRKAGPEASGSSTLGDWPNDVHAPVARAAHDGAVGGVRVDPNGCRQHGVHPPKRFAIRLKDGPLVALRLVHQEDEPQVSHVQAHLLLR